MLSDEVAAEQARTERPRGPVFAETASWTASADEAAFVLPPGAGLGDIAALMRERGIDPDDWHVERVTVNEWDALAHGGGADGEPKVVKLRQLKVFLRNRKMAVGPAVEVAHRYVPPPPRYGQAATGTPTKQEPRLVVVLGDQQAPYHDEELHTAILRWLTDVKPDEGVLTGDTADFPTISRHRDRVRWSASVKECLNASFRLLSDYRDAEPSTRWTKLRGNHDFRLESELMDRAERMAFIGPADRPGEPEEPHAYSLRRLLHLDALGITLAGREGDDWRMGKVPLNPALEVRHEPPNEKKALRLSRSIVAGHTHRQGVEPWTTFDDDENPVVHTLVHTGCLCQVKEGLGYAPDPDWQQGFATVTIWPDGAHSFDLATWRNGSLLWSGERW